VTPIRCLLPALLLVSTSIASADPLKIAFGTKDGMVVEHSIESDAIVDVIVAFRDTPLFLRPPSSKASFESRFQQFAKDLQKIGTIMSESSSETERPRIKRTYSRVFAGASVRTPQQTIAAIEALPYVAEVYDDIQLQAFGVRRPQPPLSSEAKAAAPAAAVQSGGEGIVVAVIDTGIDYHHPALGGGIGPAFKVIGGWDFANDDADPLDDHGHGTHVSGIIGGDGEGVVGIAPNVSLLAYKALSASGFGSTADLIAAVERAVDPNEDGDPADHADVVNVSIGGPGAEDNPLTQAIENAIASGVVFCIAAGNAYDFFTVGVPGNAPSAITVGATDGGDQIAAFSSKGPLPQSMSLKPDVVAPGVNIVSAKLGGGVVAESGTSMASPHVAGVAALLLAEHPDWTPAAIKSAIVNSAHILGNEVMVEGAGKVDAAQASSANVLASPPVISFGNADASTNTWTLTRDVTITNRSTNAATLNASVSGLRAGIDVTCTPSSFTLAAGASRIVSVRLTVSHAALPWPEAGSLTFGGNIAFDGAATPIHVPWAFGKAAQLEIHHATPMVPNGMAVAISGKNRLLFAFGNNTLTPPPIAAGPVDIVTIVRTEEYDQQLIVLEQQQIAGKMRIDLTAEHAPFTVRLEAEDENGAPLAAPPRFCDEHHTLDFGPDSLLSWVSVVNPAVRGFHTSALSPRITFSAMEECRDTTSQRFYIAQFPLFTGLDSSVTQTFDASKWVRQPVRLLAPPNATKLGYKPVVLGTVSRYGGFLAEGFPSSPYDMANDLWSGTLFFSDDPGGAVTHNFAPELWMDTPFDNPAIWSGIESPALRVIDDQVVPTNSSTPRVTDYRVPAQSTLTIGDAPAHPDGNISANSESITGYPFWLGPVGERRDIDAWLADVTLSDNAGNVLRTGQWTGSLPGPGIYRLHVKNNNVAVGRVQGTATFDGTIDTRNGTNTLAMFDALRIVDANGVQTSRVAPGAAATLVFALNLFQMGEPRTGSEAVRVDYRAHGTSEWHALTPVLATQQGTSIFNAGLSAVTASIEGTIDLRLSVQSPGENRIEYVVEPAFVIGEVPRRRPVRH
jgi:hypothetical protein